MSWIATAVLGGLIGLDATSFPQAMFSRPLVAGVLTGVLFGRPGDGLAIGFLMEAFALIILPIGAARYPEPGTAAVGATGAYLAATPAGLQPGALLIIVVFALVWERLGGATIVLQRRRTGRVMIGRGPLRAEELQRRHLGAMTMDFLRGAAVAVSGALLGYGLLLALVPFWVLPRDITLAALAIAAAGMLGTAVPLFGGGHQARLALAGGVLTGVVLAVAAG